MNHLSKRQKNMKQLTIVLSLLLSLPSYSQIELTTSMKLATFCKVWGFLKYYHPTVATGKIDWDKEFTIKVGLLQPLTTKRELDVFYSDWIRSLGEVKPCKACENNLADSVKFNPGNSWLTDTSRFTKELMSQFQFIIDNRNQGKNYYVKTSGPGKATFENEKPYKDSVFPSAPMRLLSLSRYWNIINYFFPYKYLIGYDWDSVLTYMIPKFLYTKDTTAYHLAMQELTAAINDSHALFITKYTYSYFGRYWPPFACTFIDNKAVVTGLENEALCRQDDIQIGDAFVSIGNVKMEDIINENWKYMSGSNAARKLQFFTYYVFHGYTDTITVAFERDGVRKQKLLHRYMPKYNPNGNESNPPIQNVLPGNIGYVNMSAASLPVNQVEQTLERVKKEKAIIFDLRSYPVYSAVFKVCEFLNPEPRAFAKFTYPDLKYPGVFRYRESLSCGKKNKSYYKGKVIVLVNETTISLAEYAAMAFRTAPDVTIIGSQTAGADGDESQIIFPGNYPTKISGLGVYYPNGKQTQRIGIVPDLVVKPTIDGIRRGEDEVLNKAIELINTLINGL
jgi:carboxyl-terminal processing protease